MKKIFIVLLLTMNISLFGSISRYLRGLVKTSFVLGGGMNWPSGDFYSAEGMSRYIFNNSDSLMAGEDKIGPVFTFGGGAELIFSDQFSLKFNLLYNVKKIHMNYPSDNISISNQEIVYKIKVIKTSLGLKYHLSDLFFSGVGFYYSFLASKVNLDINGSKSDLDSDLTHNDFGFYLESGITVPINIKLELDVFMRLNYGFLKIIDDNQSVNEELALKNKEILLLTSINYKY